MVLHVVKYIILAITLIVLSANVNCSTLLLLPLISLLPTNLPFLLIHSALIVLPILPPLLLLIPFRLLASFESPLLLTNLLSSSISPEKFILFFLFLVIFSLFYSIVLFHTLYNRIPQSYTNANIVCPIYTPFNLTSIVSLLNLHTS